MCLCCSAVTLDKIPFLEMIYNSETMKRTVDWSGEENEGDDWGKEAAGADLKSEVAAIEANNLRRIGRRCGIEKE